VESDLRRLFRTCRLPDYHEFKLNELKAYAAPHSVYERGYGSPDEIVVAGRRAEAGELKELREREHETRKPASSLCWPWKNLLPKSLLGATLADHIQAGDAQFTSSWLCALRDWFITARSASPAQHLPCRSLR